MVQVECRVVNLSAREQDFVADKLIESKGISAKFSWHWVEMWNNSARRLESKSPSRFLSRFFRRRLFLLLFKTLLWAMVLIKRCFRGQLQVKPLPRKPRSPMTHPKS